MKWADALYNQIRITITIITMSLIGQGDVYKGQVNGNKTKLFRIWQMRVDVYYVMNPNNHSYRLRVCMTDPGSHVQVGLKLYEV